MIARTTILNTFSMTLRICAPAGSSAKYEACIAIERYIEERNKNFPDIAKIHRRKIWEMEREHALFCKQLQGCVL